VAATLAVLASKEIAHGPLEALFTIDEETGMTGAFGLRKGLLKVIYYLTSTLRMSMNCAWDVRRYGYNSSEKI